MNIGEKLRKLRVESGMTQEELAKKLEVSRPLITQLERGTKVLSMNLATDIAKVLNCKLEDLIN